MLIGFVMAFLDTPTVDEWPRPSGGLRASLRNSLLMTTMVALFLGLPVSFIDRRLVAALVILSLVLVNVLPPTFT